MKYTHAAVSIQLLLVGLSALLFAVPVLAKKPSPPPPTKPIISSFYAKPQSITAGQSTTLYWSTSGATMLSIDQGIGTVYKTTKTVTPKITTTYTLTATNSAGSTSAAATVTVTAIVPPPPPPPPSPGEINIQAYTTSYSYWDNTPPGSAAISDPVLHQQAGGTGTYDYPITLAVGHSIINNVDILDYPAGTRFYIPNVRRYFIVEDTCGDGRTPQNGPCHTGYPSGTTAWVDMWMDGQSGTQSAVDACASFLTDSNGVAHLIVENPAANYVVVPGALFQEGTCTAQYGNTLVTQ